MKTTRQYIVSVITVLSVVISPVWGGAVIYVDDDASLGGDGLSWETAYRYLQDGLFRAKEIDKPVEIRIGQGIYKPDRGAKQLPGDRMASFGLISGVVLNGGYAGISMSDPNERDIKRYESVLSGDLIGDDVLSKQLNFVFDSNQYGFWGHRNVWDILVEPTRLENSTHVVVASGTDQTAVLDGFTITAGNAYHPPYVVHDGGGNFGDENDLGGAIFNEGGSPTLKSCTFVANSAIGGGAAVYNGGPCSPTILDCYFLENFSWDRGTIYNYSFVNMVMRDCMLERNDGRGVGVVMYSGLECHHEIRGCRFSQNGSNTYYAEAAVYVSGRSDGFFNHCDFEFNLVSAVASRGNMLYQSCRFMGNSGNAGGGIRHYDGKTRLDKCEFLFNKAWKGGGVFIQHYGGSVEATNCLFYGNRVGESGGAVFCENHSRMAIENSVLWNNQSPSGSDEITIEGDYIPSSRVSYCLIDGGQTAIYTDPDGILTWGPGNIDQDPLFTNPGYWNPNGTPNDSNDDFFVVGDYHLKSQAGRWDPETKSWATDDVTSPCIDAGDPMMSIGLEVFPNGGIVNMGAYGGTVEASKSYFGDPVCETIVAGDINGDCTVDFLDLAILMSHWLGQGHPPTR